MLFEVEEHGSWRNPNGVGALKVVPASVSYHEIRRRLEGCLLPQRNHSSLRASLGQTVKMTAPLLLGIKVASPLNKVQDHSVAPIK